MAQKTGEGIKSAKKYADMAASAASKASEMSKAAQRLEKKGGTLSEIDKIVKDIAWAGKIATALQVVSVGLAIAQAFFPVKTTEDQILEGVREIQRDLATLSNMIKKKFEETKREIWTADAFGHLDEHIGTIETAFGYLVNLASARAKGEDTTQIIYDIMGVKTEELDDALTIFVHNVSEGFLPPNILSLLYEGSYGDVRKLISFSTSIIHAAEMALSVKAAVRMITQNKEDLEGDAIDSFADEIAGDPDLDMTMAGKLRIIRSHCETWTQKCITRKLREENIQRYMNETAADVKPSLSALPRTANRLVDSLKQQWPWLHFTAWCFDPNVRTGYSVKGWDYTFASVVMSDEDKDIQAIVYSAPRVSDKEPKRLNQDSAQHFLGSAQGENKEAQQLLAHNFKGFAQFVIDADLEEKASPLNGDRGADFTKIIESFWPFAKNTPKGESVVARLFAYMQSRLIDAPAKWESELVWSGFCSTRILSRWLDGPYKSSHAGSCGQFIGLCSDNPAVLCISTTTDLFRAGNSVYETPHEALVYYGPFSLMVWPERADAA